MDNPCSWTTHHTCCYGFTFQSVYWSNFSQIWSHIHARRL